MNKVNRYTRAGKNGKQIVCPDCKSTHTVYHFSFYALGCQSCHSIVPKYEWGVVT